MSSIRLMNKLNGVKSPWRLLLLFPLACLLAPANGIGQTNLWSVRMPGSYSDTAPAIAPDGTI
ncbi:MAG TPA: hypothetical protein VNU95_02160, partial [Candidatus Acidoferrales bacterium]|nr:hypothetical protein [Candidatus Acidoferrales bacterium]